MAIRDAEQDPRFIVELVLLMNLPHIEYPHMTQLQLYALALRLPEYEPRVRLLTALLDTAPVNSKDYSHAISRSFDLLTEDPEGMAPDIVAPLCGRLSDNYTGEVISHFELSVFKKCEAQLRRFSSDPHIAPYYEKISEQLVLMEKNLFDPNTPQAKPD